jgi:5'-methylthioadenosine phosphorylase
VAEAEIGVFGGSGFYSFVDVLDEVEVETPYGRPSAPFVIGEVGGRRVAFLPRHGRAHELPPAQIPYRANVWAMRELGVRRLIGPCASGALRPELDLGAFVVCDQFVDRT